MIYSLLADRAVVRVSGEDRFKFLQGLLTNDVNKLKFDEGLYACMLTPQGKYYADFFLCLDESGILLDIPAIRQEEILKKLNIYKLRSAVTVTSCPEYRVVSFLSYIAAPRVFADPRSSVLGMRGFILDDQFIEGMEHDQNAYDLARITNYIAEGDKDLIPEQAFLLEYGFDSLNAIDYKKGCYIGQELIARTHYSGAIRKQIVRIESIDNLPALGTIIYALGKKIGMVCSSVGNIGLALIRTEDVLELSAEEKFITNGQEIRLIFKEQEHV